MGEERAVRRASAAGRTRRRSGGRSGAVSIADVAALAGVSTATVSRTLSAPDRVAEATREKVLRAVSSTGYTPNIAGRNLRAARTRMVLVVIPNLITPFFSELILGIDRGLSAQGYGLLMGNLHDREEQEPRLVDLVAARAVDGLILLSGQLIRSGTRRVDEMGFPIVALGIPARPTIPAVLVQDREGGAMVARHLLELGHRRFGYITGPAGNFAENERWQGFMGTLAEAGIATSEVMRYPGDYRAPSGIEAGKSFAAARRRPTAVFAVSDMMAIGFMQAVRAAGITIPDDVSVVGFDGIQFTDYCDPPLTTVQQPREAMGREAAELLVQLISGEAIPKEAMWRRLPVTLRLASSTAAPPVR